MIKGGYKYRECIVDVGRNCPYLTCLDVSDCGEVVRLFLPCRPPCYCLFCVFFVGSDIPVGGFAYVPPSSVTRVLMFRGMKLSFKSPTGAPSFSGWR